MPPPEWGPYGARRPDPERGTPPLACRHTRRVPPIRVPLELDPPLVDVVRAVRDDPRPFALVGDWASSSAIVGAAPRRVVEGTAVLEVLDGTGGGDGSGVGGGWFGFLGYGLGAAIERLPPPPPRPVPLPVASLGLYDHVLRRDHKGTWWFEALDEAALPRLDELRDRLGAPAPPRAFALDGLEPAPGALGRHVTAVADCVERITAGELFQANLTLRLEGRLHGSAADAFLAGAAALEPRHGAFVDLGGGRALLSFSPELFLRRTGGEVVTSPIKGTAPREAGAEALLASAKDAAEHVMIVDLSRNDLGRVARHGTVEPGTVRAEAHPGLWHLVTDVRARLREGTTDADLLRAAFPPGSVTGAPKIQALKVIAALEGSQREAYTGAIGFASPHAGLELNVAIRTLEVAGGRAWLGCGGGIVADSDPPAELAEALGKAAPIARALGARVPAATAPAAPAPPLPWPRRPDPAAGLLETIAVRGGEPVEAERHLARLRASARELYGIDPRVELPAGAPDGRLRVLLAPGGRLTVGAHAEPATATEVALEPRALAGGLGPHKWLDRPQDPAWLAVDLDGSVLEAAWANVWVEDSGGALLTPPADGRILPGITRARLLVAPGLPVREAPLTLADLERARAILLTSSVRLVTPAGLCGPPSERARALAAELREHPAISTKTRSYIR
jgi:para-aminobenzoate synthetase/4-amino-4-deoxychorismate lyase